MPIWPEFGRMTVAWGICATRPSADGGGTMRSAGAPRSAWAGLDLPRVHRLPGDAPSPLAGVLPPYQPTRHSRATAAASGTPSFSQSSSATNWAADGEAGSRPANLTNFLTTSSGSSAGEQRLHHVDRQLARLPQHRLQRRQRRADQLRLVRPLGMEVPGRRQADQAADLSACGQRQRQGQQPAHAIADQGDRAAAEIGTRRRAPGRAARRCSRSG